ncbi:MAG: AAA family ATPase, partial [Anaerolineae bacterium]|nr:AAA family ATPase [Anaerolineae bacterium]
FYDDWVIEERNRLQALYRQSLNRLMALYETQGHYHQAIATAQDLLAEDELREEAHRTLMRAYCHVGDRNAALAQFQRCRQIVARELGVEPTKETVGLYEAIRAGRFETRPVRQGRPVDVAPPVLVNHRGYNPLEVGEPHLLTGRETELSFLGASWSRAQTETLKAVLVRGETGVGKTHLVEVFAHNLQSQGVRVLSGRCYEFERMLPYQPIVEALRPWLLSQKPGELASLPHWVQEEISWLVPDVLTHSHSHVDTADRLQPATATTNADQRFRLFHAVAYLFAMLAHRPLLIVLEDFHWATDSTRQLMHYLLRYLAPHPFLLIATDRQEPAGRGHSLSRFTHQLEAEGLAEHLNLSRLSSAAVEKLLVEMSAVGDEILPLARRLHRETEGNPFFLMEIIKALFEQEIVSRVGGRGLGEFDQISQGKLPLPAGVSRTILSRVRRLPDQSGAALRIAAVLGREFDYDTLKEVWGQDDGQTVDAVDDLLRYRLIQEGRGAMERDYRFAHHKIQEVI